MSDAYPPEGTRVRIEWPDGSAAEGTVNAAGLTGQEGNYARPNNGGDGRTVLVRNADDTAWVPWTPAPVLPTEPGSVVVAHTKYFTQRRVMLRENSSDHWWLDGTTAYRDGELIDPVPACVLTDVELDELHREAWEAGREAAADAVSRNGWRVARLLIRDLSWPGRVK